jgi:DNA modification methylase
MLILGDCLIEMKKLKDDSVDLLFCDLPYNQTNCHWDCAIDLVLFWKEVNRVCKDTTPMFFCCSTKFGVSLINSNPKNYRYDIVFVKSSPCGFLNAKKQPLRKHEMLYLFYRKLPLYDLSSHKHKFLKDPNILKEPVEMCKYDVDKNAYGGGKQGRIKISKKKEEHQIRYEPPLPTSVITTELYSEHGEQRKLYRNEAGQYDPPLPVTVLRETDNKQCYTGDVTYNYEERDGAIYDPPLPNSVLEIKSEKGKHPTQKPTALIEWCLKYYSKEGDTVLDPTAGSGTTGVACKKMNRKFIGIEKDPEIFKVMEERLV